jgi:hypothetical protein
VDAGFKLDVNGTGRFSDALIVRNTSSTPSIWSGSYGGAISILGDNATSNRYIDLSIVDSVGALAAQGLRIINSGNVLIGTTTDAGTKLNVNGVVNATDYYFNGTSSERVVKRYTAGINVAASGYTYIASVTGSSLASAVRMTIQGTSNGVVINVLADIQVNHFQDILVTTSSGFYTQLTIRIISNGNDVFSIEIEPVAAVDATTCYVEIYPLNDEVVSFSGSPQTAIPMTMTTRQGIYTAGVGGNSGSISAGGDIYVGENLGIGTINPGERLTLNSGSTIATSRFTNTTTGLDFRLGTDGVQSSYTNMVFYSDSGNAQIWKAGSTYTSQGGAASLNLYSSNGPIAFHPNGGSSSNAMFISTSQNVLIGTTTDNGAKLQVSGSEITVRKSSSLTNPESDLGFYNSFINTNATNGTGSAISLGSNSNFGTVIYGQLVNSSTNEHLLGFQTRNSAGSVGTRMVITGGGNVGIGTSSPSDYSLLHVNLPNNKSARFGSWEINTFTVNNAWLGENVYFDGSNFKYRNNGYANLLYSDAAGGFQIRMTNGTGTAGDTISTATNLSIKPNGNVQIGSTTDAGYKLDINGSVRATYGVIYDPTSWSVLNTTASSAGVSASTHYTPFGTLSGSNPIFCTGQKFSEHGSYSIWRYNGSSHLATDFVINNSGNVGIGTTAPAYKLHVSAAGAVIQLTDTNKSANNSLWFQATSQTSWAIGTANNASSGTKMVIMDNGNIGFGVSSASSRLDVVGAGATLTGTAVYQVRFLQDQTNYRGILLGYDTSGSIGIIAADTAAPASTLAFWTYSGSAWAEKMRINGSGNVLIGTTTDAGYKLDVNGSARVSSTSNLAMFIKTSSSFGAGISFEDSTTGGNDVVHAGAIGSGFYITTGFSERFRIDSSGFVGIAATPSSSWTLAIDSLFGADGALKTTGSVNINSGALGVNVAPSATAGRIDASNDIVAYSTSDSRLKENITPIANALDKVKSLTGVEFDWKEETKHVHGYEGHDVGVIAQEVQAVLPEAIRTNDTGYLSVRYEKMIALLIEANKELAARVEELERKLK